MPEQDGTTTGRGSMPRGWRALAWTLVAAAAYEGLLVAVPGSPSWLGAVDDLLLGAVGAVAAWACLGRSRREHGTYCEGWRLIALACAVFAVGEPVFALSLVSPVPTLPGELLNAATIVLVGLGLVRMTGRSPLASRWASALDGVVIGVACQFVAWAAVLEPASRTSTQSALVQAPIIAYVGGTTALLALALLLAARWPGDTPTIVLLAAGLAVIAATNVAYAVKVLHDTYTTGDQLLDVGWVVGFLLLADAALWPAKPAAGAAPLERQWLLTLAVPSISTVVVIGTALLQVAIQHDLDGISLALAGAVLVAVVGRQFGTLLENRGLVLDLEQRVESRTQQVRRAQRQFRDLVQNSSDLILVTVDGRVTYASPAVTTILGLDQDMVRGREVAEVVHDDDLSHALSWLSAVQAEDRSSTLRCRVRHADGTWRNIEAVGSQLVEETGRDAVVLNVRDVTDRTQLEERLRFQAQHDPLTGLANRLLLQDRVRHALARSERSGEPVAVLFVDLDHFKRLNDSAGHEAGDRALVQVAEVIAGSIRPSDTAARFGGDEFAVLLEGANDVQAMEVAARLVDALTELSVPGEQARVVGASVGVASTKAGGDAESLLRDADLAMYQAKSSGRGREALFHPRMREELIEQLALEEALRAAVREEALDLVYQPIVSLEDASLTGVEVLVRWRGPGDEPVPPSLFIPLAEQIGLIGAIDAWVLRTACDEAAGWRGVDPGLDRATVNVNLSASDLHDPSLADRVSSVLAETGLPPYRLMLEITETAVLPDAAGAARQLTRLRDRGVGVSLDDFGTGFSSLATLRDLPLDEIKIDGSFVAGLEDGLAGARVLRAILRMAQALDLHVVAEAVETGHQASTLRELHCDDAQGWLFGPPMSSAELARWVGSRERLQA
jgi:diguanylate cyclase (GGDEF)-like protein/PAS domain S-box-containing protein